MYKFTGVEDQHKFCVPLNRDTETIYYDKRMLVDAKVITEPRAWKVSKIERAVTKGVAIITLYQDLYNDNTDYIEKDADGLVIGLWADYYVLNGSAPIEDSTETEEVVENEYTAAISISGVSPSLKVGGSYKTLTMRYFNIDGEEIEHTCNWNFKIDGQEVPEGLLEVITPVDSEKLNSNQIKIKFLGGEYYYGSLLQVYNDDCSLNVDIVGF